MRGSSSRYGIGKIFIRILPAMPWCLQLSNICKRNAIVAALHFQSQCLIGIAARFYFQRTDGYGSVVAVLNPTRSIAAKGLLIVGLTQK